MTIIHTITIKATIVSIIGMFVLYQMCPAMAIVAPMLISLVVMSTYPEYSLLGKEYTRGHKQAWAIQAVLFLIGIMILFLPCI